MWYLKSSNVIRPHFIMKTIHQCRFASTKGSRCMVHRSLGLAAKTSPLPALVLAQFVIALDYSIIYVALPDIAQSLRLTGSHAQWVVSAYGVLFAGFLLVGGQLCDAFGARKIYIIAMALFCLASLFGGISIGVPTLVAARGLQVLGAALLQPSIIALIAHHYRAGKERAKALTVWSAVGAAG